MSLNGPEHVLLATFDQTKKAATTNKCTSVAGHFDSHGGVMVRYHAHCPMEEVPGFHKATKRRHRATTRSVLPDGRQGDTKQNDDAICVNFAEYFDGRGSAPVLYCAHCPMKYVHGFHKSH